jgi:hypothetical protein
MNFKGNLAHLRNLPGLQVPEGYFFRAPVLDSAQQEIVKQLGMMDAAFPIFLARELEQLEAETLKVEFGDLKYDQAFQVTEDVNPGATSVTYRVLEGRGRVAPMGSNAKDAPRVSAAVKPDSYPVYGFWNSFGYSYQEMLSAQMAGRGLDTDLVEVARRAHEEELNRLAWFGDATVGLNGFFSSGVPTTTAPAGVGGVTWALKTAQEILADVMTLMLQPYKDSNGKEKPDTLGISPANYKILIERMVPNTDISLMKYILMNVPMIASQADIIDVPEFETAGAGGVRVAAGWTRKNATKVRFRNAEVQKFHPVQQLGLDWETPVSTITSGLHMKYPKSAYILEGV